MRNVISTNLTDGRSTMWRGKLSDTKSSISVSSGAPAFATPTSTAQRHARRVKTLFPCGISKKERKRSQVTQGKKKDANKKRFSGKNINKIFHRNTIEDFKPSTNDVTFAILFSIVQNPFSVKILPETKNR